MFIGQRKSLGQVHSISVNLQQGEDVTALDCIVQAAQFGSRICASALSKALLCVLGCDEIFAALPEGLIEQFNSQGVKARLYLKNTQIYFPRTKIRNQN